MASPDAPGAGPRKLEPRSGLADSRRMRDRWPSEESCLQLPLMGMRPAAPASHPPGGGRLLAHDEAVQQLGGFGETFLG
jgi:hypothetical protein